MGAGGMELQATGDFTAMPEAAAKDFHIILEKVPDDKQPETALFLSGCFSLPPASTRGIAASGPITLLSDMTRAQAETVMAELTPSLPTGVGLRIVDATEAARFSRLQWPRQPRIYGRDLSEFEGVEASGEIKCPFCGGHLRVTSDGDGIKAVPASGEKKRVSDISGKLPQPSDKDPLFSGIKPLAAGNYASIRSLQAGDTGFWMDHGHSVFAPAPIDPTPREPARSGEGSNTKNSTGKITAGLAAFMKPGAFALVVSRTRDAQTVKMISEIMGITEAEARDRCLSLGLCVAKDISLNEAQNLLSRFRSLGARARIVKPL